MDLTQAIQDKPEGGYGTICADNPWRFKTWSKKGLEGRPQHYKRMSLKEIMAMPVRELAAKDCHLFLWTSAPFLEQAFEVLRAWGFRYSSIGFVWLKLWPSQASALFFDENSFCMGQGYTTRKNSEICLLAKIGKPKRLRKDVRELIFSARREHSRKPELSYQRIQQYAEGPFVEIFSRTKRKGWVTLGDEVDKFGEAA